MTTTALPQVPPVSDEIAKTPLLSSLAVGMAPIS